MEPERREAVYVSARNSEYLERIADKPCSRTYDDEDQGRVVREDFEPGQLGNASIENVTIEDDQQDENNGKAKGPAKYGSLNDRHVWDSRDGG